MSAGFLQRFYSAFPGSTMLLSNGGGVASEAGGVLSLGHTSPAQCGWANAPLGYQRLLWSQMQAFDTVFKFETRCYSYAAGGAAAQLIQTVFTDRNSGNAIFFGWSAQDQRIYLQRYNVGSYTSVATASPTTSPHTYRTYFNPTARPLFVQESDGSSFTINSQEFQFWYRIGDAGTWTYLYTVANPLPISAAGLLNFGMASYNWSPWSSATALFNYVGVYQWDATMQLFVPRNKQVPLTNAAVDPTETIGFEDNYLRLTQSGPPVTDAGPIDSFGLGISVDEAQGKATFEDAYAVPTQGGQPLGWMPDNLPAGLSTQETDALEDFYLYILSNDPKFSTNSLDSDFHYHFVYQKPYLTFYYETSGEPWDDPTHNNFTGYARDGYKYTNGVQDSGPVSAPWRSESSGANRSARGDFPAKSLIVVTQRELVIFDLDTFDGTVPTLRMWMRFLLGNDGSSFYGLGRGIESIKTAAMANGVLAVGTIYTGWENGGLHLIDFRANTPATVYNMIRSDGEWVGQSSKTIVDRNTTGIWLSSGSYRLTTSEVRSISIRAEAAMHYIAVAGGDPSPNLVTFSSGAVQWVYAANGEDIGGSGLGNYRRVRFDENGWLWFSIGSRLYRNCFDWREGYIWPGVIDVRQGSVDIGQIITGIVVATNTVYCATVKGIYAVGKGSMQSFLAYTAAGGKGGGRLNVPPAGELIPGTISAIQALSSMTLKKLSTIVGFLITGTWLSPADYGGFVVIRLYDDAIFKSLQSPNIIEPGTLIAAMTRGS